jgi:hypothetical protein
MLGFGECPIEGDAQLVVGGFDHFGPGDLRQERCRSRLGGLLSPRSRRVGGLGVVNDDAAELVAIDGATFVTAQEACGDGAVPAIDLIVKRPRHQGEEGAGPQVFGEYRLGLQSRNKDARADLMTHKTGCDAPGAADLRSVYPPHAHQHDGDHRDTKQRIFSHCWLHICDLNAQPRSFGQNAQWVERTDQPSPELSCVRVASRLLATHERPRITLDREGRAPIGSEEASLEGTRPCRSPKAE